MKTTSTLTLALIALAFSSSAYAAPVAANGPAPTLAARQSSQSFGNQAVVDGTTLTTGLNTIGGDTYTYTDGYVIGPTITQGPSLQLNPQVTQAFGCQIVAGGIRQGDCDGVQAKIDSALATVTGGAAATQTSSSTPATSSSGSGDGSSQVSGNSNSNSNSGGTTVKSQTSSTTGGTNAAVTLNDNSWTLASAIAIGSMLAMFT